MPCRCRIDVHKDGNRDLAPIICGADNRLMLRAITLGSTIDMKARPSNRIMIRAIALLTLSLLAPPVAAYAEVLAGRASVIDGDTIEIHGQRIRLFGIDAPESGQSCKVRKKRSRCGRASAIALANKIGNRTVQCEQKDIDRYKRIIAVCRASGEDLNGWMVSQGYALAYRRYSADYIRQEESASRSKVGIWQGEFIAPWGWRRGKRLTQTQQPGACLIKGNISRGGRIYHVPGGQFYGRTKINLSKGERWFCSEAEAQAAGWRRSRR